MCLDCPVGTSSNSTAATSNATCLPCEIGTYASLNGTSICTPCPEGFFSPNLGSTSLDNDCLPVFARISQPRAYPAVGESYGNGVYNISSSSDVQDAENVFDGDPETSSSCTTSSYNASDGRYVGKTFFDEDIFEGEYIVVTFPVHVRLSYVELMQEEDYIDQAPKEYKIYALKNSSDSSFPFSL